MLRESDKCGNFPAEGGRDVENDGSGDPDDRHRKGGGHGRDAIEQREFSGGSGDPRAIHVRGRGCVAAVELDWCAGGDPELRAHLRRSRCADGDVGALGDLQRARRNEGVAGERG